MIIFSNNKINFFIRFLRMINWNILTPLVVLLMLFVSDFYSYFTYKDILYYLYHLYVLLFIIINIIHAKYFVYILELDKIKNEFVITYSVFNKEKIKRIPIENIEVEILRYGIFTRTKNYYIKFSLGQDVICKQYDFKPWSYSRMLEVYNIIKKRIMERNDKNIISPNWREHAVKQQGWRACANTSPTLDKYLALHSFSVANASCQPSPLLVFFTNKLPYRNKSCW